MSAVPGSNLLNEMNILTKCPVEWTPLTNAVNLHPCNHKISRTAAERIYGAMRENTCERQGVPCAVCKTPVTFYAADHTMQQLASLALHHQEDSSPIPTPSAVLPSFPFILTQEENVNVSLPYPGPPAVFIHESGDWNRPVSYQSQTYQRIGFKSTTQGSLLRRFSVKKLNAKNVVIVVAFAATDIFSQYLRNHGIIANCSYGIYETRTPAELQTIFHIIAHHNQIPIPYFDQIREIVGIHISESQPRSYACSGRKGPL